MTSVLLMGMFLMIDSGQLGKLLNIVFLVTSLLQNETTLIIYYISIFQMLKVHLQHQSAFTH